MATNICSKTRTKYITPKEFAEIYRMSRQGAYKLLGRPIFKEAIFKPSEKLIRVDENKAHEIMKQHFNN